MAEEEKVRTDPYDCAEEGHILGKSMATSKKTNRQVCVIPNCGYVLTHEVV